MSGFSGAVLSAESIPPGVDPIDKTIIDVSGASLRVFDLSSLGAAPAGQLVTPPIKLEVQAKDIGQVFALVADDGPSGGPPSLYAAATSAYGIQIVGAAPDSEGKPVRLKSGAPVARFMEGQFGGLPGGGPGSIWKVDSATGAVTLFANTTAGGRANSGPGIGGLAFDPQGRNIYASDLDSGLIHRFSLESGADAGTFDHGVSGRPAHGGAAAVADDGTRMDITSPAFKPGDVATWGMTRPERRVHALAVQQGRLYYAVAAGSEIWSVDLKPDGSFGADVRFEVAVKTPAPLPVTSIVFDDQGRMLLAQRGAPKSAYDYGSFVDGEAAQVLRYLPAQSPARWAPDPQSYAVGAPERPSASVGGIGLQYGYTPDGQLDLTACGKMLLVTGDHLRVDGAVDGVQISGIDLVRPADAARMSAFFDFDARQDDPTARGHVGSVVAIHRCGATGAPGTGFPPLADEGTPPVVNPGAGAPPVADSGAGGGGGAAPPVVDAGAGEAAPPVVDAGGGAGAPPLADETPPVADEAPADAPKPAPNGLTVLKRAAANKCSPEGDCPFEITITNTGATALPGPIAFKDELSQPGAAAAGAAPALRTKPPAPWQCTDEAPWLCRHPGPLAAGQSLTFTVAVQPSNAKDVTEVKNCATLTTPPEAKPAAVDDPAAPQVENLSEPSCATMPGPAAPAGQAPAPGAPPAQAPPPEQTKSGALQIAKRAVGQNCDPVTGKGCEFEITITNTGATEFKGPVEYDETITADGGVFGGTTLQPVSVQPWSCSKSGQQFKCAIADLTLPAGATSTVAVGVILGAGSGAAQKLKNCAQLKGAEAAVCAEIDRAQPQQPPPGQPAPGEPLGNSQLKIEKRATVTTCAAKGGGCSFEIVVTNTSATRFIGPIEVEDVVKTVKADGAAAGGALINTPMPGPPWTCSAPAGQAVACKTAPTTTLAPGESIKLPIAFMPKGNEVEAARIENCAHVKGAAAEACDKIIVSQQAGPKLRVEKVQTSSGCAPECRFEIRVRNVGNAPYSGEIAVLDVLSQAKAGTVDAELNVTQPWTCTKPTPNVHNCKLPQPVSKLQPGGSVAFTAFLTVHAATVEGAKADAFEGQNCASVNSGPADVRDNEQAGRCVPISVPIARGQPNLSVEKRALSPTCGLKGDGKPCLFAIWVSNVGDKPYQGKIKIIDAVFSGEGADRFASGAVFAKGGGSDEWACSLSAEESTKVTCEHPSITLNPGSNTALTMEVTPGANWSKNNILQNCAEVIRDGAGNDPGTANGDDTSCAFVRLDPYALKIDKTGSQSCEPGGECRFELTIFNDGPIPHEDPVTIVDGLAGDGLQSAEIVSITPPLPCPQQPTRIPFQCTVPKMKLEVGDKFTHAMVVRIPADAKSFRNCAIISSPETAAARTEAPPPAGARVAEATDCHDVAVEPQETTETPPPGCSAGMVLIAANRCACPAGTDWNGRACLAEAQPLPPPPLAPAPLPPATEICSGARPVGTYPNCCPRGTRYDARRDRCVRPTSPEPEPAPARVCSGARPVGVYPNCCPRGTRYDARRGRCARPTSPESAPPPPSRVCSGARPVGTYPNCCPRGYEYSGSACRRPQPLPPVDAGGIKDKLKSCPDGSKVPRWKRCPTQQRPAPQPKPQPQQPQRPAKCPPGQIGRPPYCRPIQRPTPKPAKCPPGTYGTPPKCTGILR